MSDNSNGDFKEVWVGKGVSKAVKGILKEQTDFERGNGSRPRLRFQLTRTQVKKSDRPYRRFKNAAMKQRKIKKEVISYRRDVISSSESFESSESSEEDPELVVVLAELRNQELENIVDAEGNLEDGPREEIEPREVQRQDMFPEEQNEEDRRNEDVIFGDDENGSNQEDSGSDESESESYESQSGSDEAQSGSDESQSGGDESQSGSDESQSRSDESQSRSDESQSRSDESQSRSDESDSGSDESDSGSDESESGSDESESGSDKSESGSDKSASKSDHAENRFLRKENLSLQKGNDGVPEKRNIEKLESDTDISKEAAANRANRKEHETHQVDAKVDVLAGEVGEAEQPKTKGNVETQDFIPSFEKVWDFAVECNDFNKEEHCNNLLEHIFSNIVMHKEPVLC